MENYADFLSTPPMYRDIGSTFLAYQMPIPISGMPYAGGYGIAPMKPALTADKFEAFRQRQEKGNANRNKILAAIGGTLAAGIALVVLKKKVPAVGNAISQAGNWVKNLFHKPPTVNP